jgi:DNA gyrase/topoisomerase IV subunit A
MHLFNADKLCKYATVKDIIEDFCVVRMKTYQDRKNYMINNLERLLKSCRTEIYPDEFRWHD